MESRPNRSALAWKEAADAAARAVEIRRRSDDALIRAEMLKTRLLMRHAELAEQLAVDRDDRVRRD